MGLLFAKEGTGHLKVSFGRQNNPDRPYNAVRTTKYSLLTFFPKSLILQFTRAANIVYLISAVLQSIAIISSLSPITAIGPLMFVLLVGLVREGYEDYNQLQKQKRHSKDVEVNERQTQRLSNGVFSKVRWQQIKAGDLIKVTNNEVIPCDLVVLYTTQQNSICYIETSNLDGETNLKTKFAFVDQIVLYPDQFNLLQGYLEVERPNSNLYQFNGVIKLDGHEERELTFENLLLRETHLRNTAQAVGVAVYCGAESKIMMNKGHIQHKLTRVQKKVNIIQFALFIILIILCAVCSIGFYLYHQSVGRDNFFYLKGVSVSLPVEALLIFFSCFLLLNFLIPVSLNVLLEFIKAFLTGFLSMDKKFKDEFCDGIHVGNMSIMQQLGVVDYILTDKTGTLTANQMVFKSCCIQDKVYSREKLQARIQTLTQSSAFHNFWLAVVICHDVIRDSSTSNYQGSSPDEVCFVEFARNCLGYQFVKRTKNYLQLNIRGQKVVYELLEMIPFSSRRRMSVMVRSICDKNQILLFTKGADSAIFQQSLEYKYQSSFQSNINQYAIEGLRTLVFGYRKVNEQELKLYREERRNVGIYKFNKSKTQEEIERMENQLVESTQSGLNILGATAIQDKLQDKVPETIARLQQAGMTIMMITGDKLQTAQNIGYLANLIKKNFKIVHFRSNLTQIKQLAQAIVDQIQRFPNTHIGVIIQGACIRRIVQEEDVETVGLYAKLLRKSTSLIFCRSSPKEKALIVKFVKHKLQGVVLAVGDGGNDIGMIEEANIGVGILGREGNSAAAASDFYFGQFKHLDRLLLHHGRWFYMRISYFFVYYGWKNLIMTVLMFLYILRSAYSGYPAFSDYFITMYNLLIGMYLIGSYGVWEQDINDDLYPDVWEKLPALYKADKARDLFSYQRYMIWTVMGVALAVVLQFFINLAMGDPSSTGGYDGFPVTYDGLYNAKSISVVIITLLVLIIDIKTFTWYTITIVMGLFTFGLLVLVYILENYCHFGRGYRSLADNDYTKFYLVILVVGGVTLAVKLIINMGQVEMFPTEVDRILKQKSKKGLLSIGNLNPNFHPKQLLMTFHSKIFTSRQIGNESPERRKRTETAPGSEEKNRRIDRITTEIELNPKIRVKSRG